MQIDCVCEVFCMMLVSLIEFQPVKSIHSVRLSHFSPALFHGDVLFGSTTLVKLSLQQNQVLECSKGPQSLTQ